MATRMGNYIHELRQTVLPSASTKQHDSRPTSPMNAPKSPEKPPKKSKLYIIKDTCTGRRMLAKTAEQLSAGQRRQLARAPVEIEMEPGSVLRQLAKDASGEEQCRRLCEEYQGVVGAMKEPKFAESLDVEHVFVVCPKEKLAEISPHQADVLLGVDDCRDRFFFWSDSHRYEKVAKLKIGDEVECLVEDFSKAKYDIERTLWTKGKIQYIGKLKKNSSALYFGVLLKDARLGDCDGTFKGLRLFDCASPTGAVVVAAHRLRPPTHSSNSLKKALKHNKDDAANTATWYTSPPGAAPSSSATSSSPTSSTDKATASVISPSAGHSQTPSSAAATAQSSLTAQVVCGDRVVWLNNSNEACYGTVKWVGTLENTSTSVNELYAGVEFDKPIGGGTGRYQNREYFRAKMNHASFVPLIGLMRKEDFEHNQMTGKNKATRKPSLSVILSSDKAAQGDFTVGSCVEVPFGDGRRFGVVRYVGDVIQDDVDASGPAASSCVHTSVKKLAGLEMEDDLPLHYTAAPTDGSYNGRKYFDCVSRRGYFAVVSDLKADHRFSTPVVSTFDFGPLDSGDWTDYVAPLAKPTRAMLLQEATGPNKGIQGHRNSCYLDATLYAMFAHTRIFDDLLLRPPGRSDIKQYTNLVSILSNEIVYPLRKKHYVRADRVVKFRELLSNLLPDIQGLTSDEKDPEEFLNAFLQRLLKAQPYVKLIHNGKEEEQSYLCQLITEDAASVRRFTLPTVQTLLERSFFDSQLRFRQVPRVLIIQLPRYGTQRVYDRIVPPIQLDVTFLVDSTPKPCRDCSKLAKYYCEECFLTKARSMEDITFCHDCFDRVHYDSGEEDMQHKPKRLQMSRVAEAAVEQTHLPIPTHKLELLSVLCIETSHYVSFTRVGEFDYGRDWLFFDSMADREGFSQGYNIPHVRLVEDMGSWLTTDGYAQLAAATSSTASSGSYERAVPDHVKRLLKDCYICFYASKEALMYSG